MTPENARIVDMRGEVLGAPHDDWPVDLETYAERKAYQRGVADARRVDALKASQLQNPAENGLAIPETVIPNSETSEEFDATGLNAIVETVMHKAMEFACAFNDGDRAAGLLKKELQDLISTFVHPLDETSTAILLQAVEDYYRGAEEQIMRATVAAVLEATEVQTDSGNFKFSWQVTIDLDKQRTIWDRFTLTSNMDDDSVTFYLTLKA